MKKRHAVSKLNCSQEHPKFILISGKALTGLQRVIAARSQRKSYTGMPAPKSKSLPSFIPFLTEDLRKPYHIPVETLHPISLTLLMIQPLLLIFSFELPFKIPR